jgi:actin-related protein
MNQPIVIDNGTGVLKAGFAGADKPRVAFRSYIGRVKHQRVMPGVLQLSDVNIDDKLADRLTAGRLLESFSSTQ